MEIRRILLAFALSAAVLILWPKLFPPPQTPPAPTPTAAAPAPASASTAPALGAAPAATAPATPAATPAAAAPAPPAPVPVAVPELKAGGEETVEVSTPLYVARLTNRGGALVSFALVRHRDHERKPLDLVPRGKGFPGAELRLDPADPFLGRAAKAFHVVERETEGAATVVRFRYREADGSALVRTYRFGDGYVVGVRAEREGPGQRPVAVVLGPGIGNPTADEVKATYKKPGGTVVLKQGGSVDHRAQDGLKEALPAGPDVSSAGLEDTYFLTSFLAKGQGTFTLRPASVVPAEGAEPVKESEVVLTGTGVVEADAYIGPKEPDVLEKVRPGMSRVIDYGWFAILAKPLLGILRWFHSYAPNWGVAIILITILIKVVLFPLTYKQLVSMKRMADLQPKIETIRAKWTPKVKSDPQARLKMNEELMGLYKTEGINPAGGCIPLLLQMPILFAFYQMLANAIELRHAPFALWIQDLSAKDPYYVTPILMTLTMWVQQQMTPTTGDATQRKILAIMPFVFGFMFKDLPSGLVLYWLVQNVLTIVQQLLLNRFTDLGPAPAGAGKAKKG